MRRWNGTIASKTDPHWIGTGMKLIGSVSERNRKQNFSKKTKCDVKIMANSIRQSDEPELRRRWKNFLQQCRRCGSDVTERCDDVGEEIVKPANEYRSRRNDVTEDVNQQECWHGTHQIEVQQAGRKMAVWRTGDLHPNLRPWGDKLAADETARKHETSRSRGRKMPQKWRCGCVRKDA